ncbi:dentin sialophosphoprotein-like [Hetaerina americana]|uniref:dentin sialophosphoprotein-like n=1 Tax=Hetaerina americana TaxID=62018 RepID=UPI003A7F305A
MLIVESSPLCRLCLQTGTWNINIFDPDGTNGFIVWKVIKELLGIEISKTDGLPSNICDACMKKLMEFKYFKKMCINSKIEFLKLQLNQGLIIPVNIEDEGFSLQIERSLQSVGHQEVDEIHVKVEEGIDLDEPSDNETTSLTGNDSEDSEGNGQEADGSSQSETSVKIERSDPDEALDNEVASIADEDSEDSEQEMDGSNEEEESDASSVAIRRQHDPINQSSKTLEFEEEQLTEQATKSFLLLSTKGQQRSSRSREAKKSDLGQCRSKETSEEDDPVAPSSSKSKAAPALFSRSGTTGLLLLPPDENTAQGTTF